jgi:hypothetical protein
MKCSRADSRVKTRSFPDVSALISVLIIRVSWRFGTQHTWKMGTELVPETSENLHILTRLSARENFLILSRGIFKTYTDC